MKAFIRNKIGNIKASSNITLALTLLIVPIVLCIFSLLDTKHFSTTNPIRFLTSTQAQTEENKLKHFQFRWSILSHLIRKSYRGKWSTSSNTSFANFTETKGAIELVFNFLQRTNILGTFYYDYNIILFDGEDNNQSVIISNSYFFTLNSIDKPNITYDNETNVISIYDELQSYISQYSFLALINQNKSETNTTMNFYPNHTGQSNNTELNGTISINDIVIDFNAIQSHPAFYQAVSSFCCWLAVLGIMQAFFFNYQLKLFTNYPDEAFKYSPYTFVINCLYNGAIGFECFLAAMINERFFYIFIIPSVIYFINFCFIELKLILETMNIHEINDSRQTRVLISLKSRLIHSCIFFYFLLICLFIYSFDVFFRKTISFCLVAITFIPQMIYGIKKTQNASIGQLLLISFNKLYLPIYFRTKGNFLNFKEDYLFISTISIVLGVEVLIILFQKLLWRTSYTRNNQERDINTHHNANNIHNSQHNNNKKLYKTIEELQKKNIDINNCSICLGELNTLNQLHTNSNNSILVVSEENKNEEDIGNANDKSKDSKTGKEKEKASVKVNCCRKAFKCFKIKGKKEIPIQVMMTPCKHIFHIECLEEWLKIKYSCPQCRSVLH